jgi:hypothetical protein
MVTTSKGKGTSFQPIPPFIKLVGLVVTIVCSLWFSDPKVDDDVAHVTFGPVPISTNTKVGEMYLKFGKMV